MSAPRDLRFVSTQDGSTWERKGYDRDGSHALYAQAGSIEDCPRLWSVRELAELGLRGMADVLPVPVGRELTEVERLRAQLATVERQRAALAERLRAGQTWESGRLVGEDLVGPTELREIFGIPLAAPLNGAEAGGITRRFAPAQALREDGVYPQGTAQRVQLRGPVEDPHDSPLHHTYRVPRDLPAPEGA